MFEDVDVKWLAMLAVSLAGVYLLFAGSPSSVTNYAQRLGEYSFLISIRAWLGWLLILISFMGWTRKL